MASLYLLLLINWLLILLLQQASGHCIPPGHCIEDMEEADAKERFEYVLSKYEELQMKIIGQPLGLHGKIITRGEIEEQHIVFQYVDNTLHDVIQNCVFLLTKTPGECESIETVCNTFLPRTPRPLLERKPLSICDEGMVREKAAETEPPAVEETQSNNETTVAAQLANADADLKNDSELI